MSKTSLAALAVTFIGFSAGEATAQPQMTWQMVGNAVRIDWSAVPGATLYDLSVSGTLAAQVTIPTTYVQVTAPAGTYVLQVRGRSGATVGPYSEPVTIVVGGPTTSLPCSALSAPPGVNVTTSGNIANLTWDEVQGAVGYRVQLGRTPGGTEYQIDVPASQRSYSGAIPLTGTFYARVLAGSTCGFSPAAERSFTVGAATPGSGTPTAPAPNPTPAAPPTFVPNLLAQVQACRARYPAEFACAHTGASCTRQFIVYCARDLNRLDPWVGLNWKRGAVGSLSEDIIAYRGVGPAVDIVNGGAMEIIDVIFSAGAPSASIGWNPGPGGPGDRGAWVNPFSINP